MRWRIGSWHHGGESGGVIAELPDAMHLPTYEPIERSGEPDEGELTMHVLEVSGQRFVAPSSVMEMLRGMMVGPAAAAFCDRFELALRRSMDKAAGGPIPPGGSAVRSRRTAVVATAQEAIPAGAHIEIDCDTGKARVAR